MEGELDSPETIPEGSRYCFQLMSIVQLGGFVATNTKDAAVKQVSTVKVLRMWLILCVPHGPFYKEEHAVAATVTATCNYLFLNVYSIPAVLAAGGFLGGGKIHKRLF